LYSKTSSDNTSHGVTATVVYVYYAVCRWKW